MKKIYITYTSDGYNDQVVDCVFTRYEAAYMYLVGKFNPTLTGEALQAFAALPSTKSYWAVYIHEFDLID